MLSLCYHEHHIILMPLTIFHIFHRRTLKTQLVIWEIEDSASAMQEEQTLCRMQWRGFITFGVPNGLVKLEAADRSKSDTVNKSIISRELNTDPTMRHHLAPS